MSIIAQNRTAARLVLKAIKSRLSELAERVSDMSKTREVALNREVQDHINYVHSELDEIQAANFEGFDAVISFIHKEAGVISTAASSINEALKMVDNHESKAAMTSGNLIAVAVPE